MLPFDNRPWAKSLAKFVIGLSVFAAIAGSYYLYSIDQLHVPEITGVLLLLLTIIPPNVALVMRKKAPNSTSPGSGENATLNATLHPR